MPFSVSLLWSAEAESALSSIQIEVAKAGVNGWTAQAGHRPHLELAQCGVIDSSAMRTELKRLASAHESLELTLTRLELAGQEVVIHIEPTPSLIALHQALHVMMKKVSQAPRPDFAPGRWTPKLSLVPGVTPANLEKIKPILGSIILPWPSQATSLGVFLTNPNRMGIQAEVMLGTGQFRDRTHG
jgi:hypothetical protein